MRSIRLVGTYDITFLSLLAPVPEQWKMASEYRCRHCGGPAYKSPYSSAVWGCSGEFCSYSTEALSDFFIPAFVLEEYERSLVVASD